MNPETLLDSTTAIARQAGRILLKNFRQPIARSFKSSDIDIVTAADKETEAYIVPELLKLHPTHHIVGEEGGGQGAPRDTSDYLWYVDPLDGTVNFASNIPYFGVAIALVDKALDPLLGVIYNPCSDEMFTATKGGGAFMNGQPLKVSDTPELSQAVLTSGFAYDRRTNPDNNLAQWNAFTLIARDMRRFGSAALDLCGVAAGRGDGFWERNLNPWDAVAGMLIAREAGAIVTDYEGDPMPHTKPDGRYLAANPMLHPQMMAVLRESYNGTK